MIKKILKLFWILFIIIFLSMGLIYLKNKFTQDTEETQINYTQKYNNCLKDKNILITNKDIIINKINKENTNLKSKTCINKTEIVFKTNKNQSCKYNETKPSNKYILTLIRQIELLEEVNEYCYFSNETEKYQNIFNNLTNCLNKIDNLKEDLI